MAFYYKPRKPRFGHKKIMDLLGLYALHILVHLCFRPKYTAVRLRKTSLLHKQIKNCAILAYKNSVRKCYQGSFFIANMQFNNPTSMPQT